MRFLLGKGSSPSAVLTGRDWEQSGSRNGNIKSLSRNPQLFRRPDFFKSTKTAGQGYHSCSQMAKPSAALGNHSCCQMEGCSRKWHPRLLQKALLVHCKTREGEQQPSKLPSVFYLGFLHIHSNYVAVRAALKKKKNLGEKHPVKKHR